jgi:hypothetical protein
LEGLKDQFGKEAAAVINEAKPVMIINICLLHKIKGSIYGILQAKRSLITGIRLLTPHPSVTIPSLISRWDKKAGYL